MEYITDVTLIIDRKKFEDREILKWISPDYDAKKNDSCWKVKGTFEKVNQLVNELEKGQSIPAIGRQTAQRTLHAPPCSISVNQHVMEYIKEKCVEKFNKIQGGFLIQISPLRNERGANSDPRNTVQLTFKARGESTYSDSVHLDFVRQRFITFYQRTASDLQITSLNLAPFQVKELQRKFPLLIFNPGSSKNTTVCGPFAHVQKLKDLLSQIPESSGSSPSKRVPASSLRYKSPAPLPKNNKPADDEACPICMELIPPEKKKALQCKHSFCKDCLQRAFDYKPVCPICGEVYGTLKGTQPDGGKMDIRTSSTSLPGYEHHGTIVIHYHIPSGIQKKEHPNPGQPFQGVSRTAYLPNSPEGKKVVELLRKAFDQKLIFTIGRSSTSGRNNMVTWNDIHHKTSTHGGPTSYGYPDPDYLNRVQEELKAKGIK